MRKDQVAPATVQIDCRAEFPEGEGRALDVPTRAPRSPHGLPRRLVVSRRLPEDEVERMTLGRIVHVAAALAGEPDHLLLGVETDRAEIGGLRHVEIHRSPGLVGETPIQNHSDETPDVRDCRRGTGRAEHREGVERDHVALEASLLPGGEIEIVHAKFTGLREQRVVHVGDVANALHCVAEVDEPALEDGV